MTHDYILSCESTVDLPRDYVTGRDISVIYYSYIINDVSYRDGMLSDPEGRKRLYDALVSTGDVVKTSQINIGEYLDYFEPLLQQGDVLHIEFGSGMTGSINNARQAAEELLEKYPGRKLIIVDSLCSSGGYGMLTDYAADLRDTGYSIEQLEQWILDNRLKIHHHFFTSDLKYFRKSGRMSGATATLAAILNIIPVMRLDDKGKILAYDKVRGKQAAVNRMIDIMLRHADGGAGYSGKCFVDTAFNEADGKILFEKIKETFPNISDLRFYDIGDIITSHTGPGTVSFYFIGDDRVSDGEPV